jgi:ABC-type uncharacterized transport system permease subunit
MDTFFAGAIALLHLAAMAGYLGSWAIFVRAFREGGGPSEEMGWKVALAAAGVHALALVVFTVARNSVPLVGLGPASSTLALAIAVLLLGASRREEVRPTILFVLPLILLLLAEAVAVGIEPTTPTTEFRGIWLWAHVGTVFVGYAALALASAAAAMYVLQFRTLKRKEFGSVFSFFPSLDTLDGLNRTGLKVGFSALTLGLIAGWSRTLSYGQGFELADPQVIFGIITWVAYLVAIGTRMVRRGKREWAARATVGAFLVTAAAFGVLRITVESGGFFL